MILFLSCFLLAFSSPEKINHITDEVGVLSENDINETVKIYRTLERNTQVYLIIVKSTGNYLPDKYGRKIAEKLGLKENYVVLVVATEDKEIGMGESKDLHKIFKNAKEKIIERTLFHCKGGKWNIGAEQLLLDTIKELNKYEDISYYTLNSDKEINTLIKKRDKYGY